jgi:transposase-like protein
LQPSIRNHSDCTSFVSAIKDPIGTTYGKAIASHKREGKLPEATEHRQIKYHNNVIEGNHGKLKRRFKSMKTAYATINLNEQFYRLY